MIYPALTRDSDLASFPGAPYSDAVIRAAELDVRREANWHIAPPVAETLLVECTDRVRLVLKTLRIVTVTSVTDENSLAVTGFRVRSWGVLYPPDGQWWTLGMVYSVALTHGYDSADDLLPVVASRCQRMLTDPALSQRSETVGQRTSSESYNVARFDGSLGPKGTSPLGRYCIRAAG